MRSRGAYAHMRGNRRHVDILTCPGSDANRLFKLSYGIALGISVGGVRIDFALEHKVKAFSGRSS